MQKSMLSYTSIVLRFIFFLSTILFAIYLFAPLFGGQFHLNAVITYGSWVGLAFLLMTFLKIKQRGQNINLIEFIISYLYFVLCMFIWFSSPLNILFCILGGVGILVGYKAQKFRKNQ